MGTRDLSPCLRFPLHREGIQVDFLRIAPGEEEHVSRSFADDGAGSNPSLYWAFGEWDAISLRPSHGLWGEDKTGSQHVPEALESVTNSTGFFAYLYDHPVNRDWKKQLTQGSSNLPVLLVCIRFRDQLRKCLGLGAELSLCAAVERWTRSRRQRRPGALVCHTTGWYDAVVMIRPQAGDQTAILTAIDHLRGLTLRDLLDTHAELPEFAALPLGAEAVNATYHHILVPIHTYVAADNRRIEWGHLTRRLRSVRVLLRVDPDDEASIRGSVAGNRDIEVLREFGRFGLSLRKRTRGSDPMEFVRQVRSWIPSRRNHHSGAETCTVLAFSQLRSGEPVFEASWISDPSDDELRRGLRQHLKRLDRDLSGNRASDMVRYRFGAVLTALASDLADRNRAPAVRHVASFVVRRLNQLLEPGRLDRSSLEALCHLLEYAMWQAVDGLLQVQFDANGFGLTGRGGYGRLSLAVWHYCRDAFDITEIPQDLEPLLTFGLSETNALGTSKGNRVDIPFRVANTVSRWHVILHELGHILWKGILEDFPMSLACYEALNTETPMAEHAKPEGNEGVAEETRSQQDPPTEELSEAVSLTLLRTAKIVDELYPQLLVCATAFGRDISACRKMQLRSQLQRNTEIPHSRYVATAVVTDMLLQRCFLLQDTLFANEDVGPETLVALFEADCDGCPKTSEGIKRAVCAALTSYAWWCGWRIEKSDGDSITRILKEMPALLEQAHGEVPGASRGVCSHLKQVLRSPGFHHWVARVHQKSVVALGARASDLGRSLGDSEAIRLWAKWAQKFKAAENLSPADLVRHIRRNVKADADGALLRELYEELKPVYPVLADTYRLLLALNRAQFETEALELGAEALTSQFEQGRISVLSPPGWALSRALELIRCSQRADDTTEDAKTLVPQLTALLGAWHRAVTSFDDAAALLEVKARLAALHLLEVPEQAVLDK